MDSGATNGLERELSGEQGKGCVAGTRKSRSARGESVGDNGNGHTQVYRSAKSKAPHAQASDLVKCEDVLELRLKSNREQIHSRRGSDFCNR